MYNADKNWGKLGVDRRLGLPENADHVHDEVGQLSPLVEQEDAADDQERPAEGGRGEAPDGGRPAGSAAAGDLGGLRLVSPQDLVELVADVVLAAAVELERFAEMGQGFKS